LAFDTSSISGMSLVLIQVIIYTVIGLLLASMIGAITYMYLQWKRYNYEVWIYEQNADGEIVNPFEPKIDKGGIFIDKKTNNEFAKSISSLKRDRDLRNIVYIPME